jgi:DnaJ-class molecular chaperone
MNCDIDMTTLIEVLSDEEKKNFYDTYGDEGLRRMYESGSVPQSPNLLFRFSSMIILESTHMIFSPFDTISRMAKVGVNYKSLPKFGYYR